MSAKLKSILKYLLFLGIGASLLYLAFRNTEFDKLMNDFRQANYWYVVGSMIMGYLAFVSRGIRWKYLLEPMGHKVKTWSSIHAITMGYFTNAILPRAGEVARCTALYQVEKVPVNKLFGTVIVERIVDLIMLVALALLTLVLEYDKIIHFFDMAFEADPTVGDSSIGIWWKVLLALLIAGSGIILYLFRDRFSDNAIYVKVREFYYGLKDGLRSFNQMDNKLPFILHTLFIWSMYFLMSYTVVFALPSTEHIGPSEGLFVVIVSALGILAPSPGGIGTFHYFAMLGMTVVGVAEEDGLSFATLVHGGQTLMTILAGLVSTAAIYRLRKKAKKKQDDISRSPARQAV